ncbi:RNA-binding protein 1 [Penaeus vannamei]|uniref:RNA-binding protein 1 n=1 Tax=Penaeus vannamei TaxID=6689 RepID=A0A3R7Q212_PENVA|nr:RNA-binding protein 1 [Penaeus vannamei]
MERDRKYAPKRMRTDCKVYVGNLGNTEAKHELESAFSKYGPLVNVWVARNPPGFAFVEFEDPRDAEDAVRSLNGTRLCGVRVKVGRPLAAACQDGVLRQCKPIFFTTMKTLLIATRRNRSTPEGESGPEASRGVNKCQAPAPRSPEMIFPGCVTAEERRG